MIQDVDASRLMASLTAQGLRATKISTTGGFLRKGNTTLVMGVYDDQVDDVIAIIKECCSRRRIPVNLDPGGAVAPGSEFPVPVLTQVEVGGAVIFVSPVERFERI